MAASFDNLLVLRDVSLFPEPRRTADILLDVLIENGVEVVFGLPGGAIAPLYDALVDRPQVRLVTTKHECGAMFAAASYARTTGKLGVVLVTSGPGILNAMTGLASAFCDGIPVLLLAGEVSRKVMGKGALQEGSAYHLDVVGMARRISKLAFQVNEPNAAASSMRRAIATALSGRRGPVTVTLPFDVTSAKIVESEICAGAATSFSMHARAIDRAAAAVQSANRPLIFAGSGVRWDDAPARLLEVAEMLQCPVITTPKGKGVFPEDHPLALGIFGLGGHPSSTEYLHDGIDALLAVGTSLGELSTNGWTPRLLPSGEFIHVDIDANQIGKCYPATLSVAAPAEAFLARLRDRLYGGRKPKQYGIRRFTDPSTASCETASITPQRALWELQQIMPRDTIFTIDSGDHFVFSTHYLTIASPDSFIAMTGLGSMGQSIGAAIGAQLARKDRTVVAICGDGCFAMTCGEISTAVAEHLPIVIVVMNDERLGMVERGLSGLYGRAVDFSCAPMNVIKIAEGLGAAAYRIDHPGDILTLEALKGARDRTIVLDVRIDKTSTIPKHERFDAMGSGETG